MKKLFLLLLVFMLAFSFVEAKDMNAPTYTFNTPVTFKDTATFEGTVISGDTLIDVTLGSDIDANSFYINNSPTITNLASNGAGYWFDGVDDGIAKQDTVVFGFTDFPLTIVSKLKTNSVAGMALGGLYDLSGINRWITIRIQATTGLVVPNIRSTVEDVTGVAGSSVNDGKWHQVVVVFESAISRSVYVDGEFKGTNTGSIPFPTGIDNLSIGIHGDYTPTDPFTGTINDFRLYNKALTATEVKDLYSNANIPYELEGASNTALTTGSLVVGKEYIIDTFVAGDDFVNVGGTNTTGTVFTATGTSPTTWTNASSLRTQGNVADYNSSGVGAYTWVDCSGNENYATNSGAIRTNIPSQYPSVAVQSFTTDASMTDALPADYLLKYIWVENNSAVADTLDFGTTAMGSELATAQVIPASVTTVITLNKAITAESDVFVWDTNGNGWGSTHLIKFVGEDVK